MKIIVCGKVRRINTELLNLANFLNGKLKRFLILKQDNGYMGEKQMHTPDLVIFYSGCSGKTTFSMRILKLTLNWAPFYDLQQIHCCVITDYLIYFKL